LEASHITASVACAQDIGATATAFARALASTNVATHVGTSSALLKGGASTLIQLVLVPRAAAAIGLRGELADIAIATVPTTSTSIASVVDCSDAVTAPTAPTACSDPVTQRAPNQRIAFRFSLAANRFFPTTLHTSTTYNTFRHLN
jgi:hypothetical protein